MTHITAFQKLGAYVYCMLSPQIQSSVTNQAFPVVEFKEIVCVTDFSSCADAALRCGAAIARAYGSQVHLLHVLEPKYTAIPPATIEPGFRERHRYEAEVVLKSLMLKNFADLRRDAEVLEGDVVDSIRHYVDFFKADLIVLGTHGRTGLNRLMLGSVTDQILHTVSCPVLSVGPHVQHLDPVLFDRILYATDFSWHADKAWGYATSIARRVGGEVVLLHVNEQRGSRCGLHGASEIAFAREHLQAAADSTKDIVCSVAVRHSASADDVILDFARKNGMKLIVMGIRGMSATTASLAAHAPGGVAQRVICQATCPVLGIP